MKQNCWEYMQCGREPGGENARSSGICPTATINHYNGFNNGFNAGRICWTVSGTLCKEIINGNHAKKIKSCLTCDFFKNVQEQEGHSFRLVTPYIREI